MRVGLRVGSSVGVCDGLGDGGRVVGVSVGVIVGASVGRVASQSATNALNCQKYPWPELQPGDATVAWSAARHWLVHVLSARSAASASHSEHFSAKSGTGTQPADSETSRLTGEVNLKSSSAWSNKGSCMKQPLHELTI